jgi:hypothetical protein
MRSAPVLLLIYGALLVSNTVTARQLTQSEVAKLIEICPNIPHGQLLQKPPPLQPNSKEAKECDAFEPLYKSCGTAFAMSFWFGGRKMTPQMFRDCLKKGYTGP